MLNLAARSPGFCPVCPCRLP
ncbi:hypothetical protein [Hongsoonwoonella zoysiae]